MQEQVSLFEGLLYLLWYPKGVVRDSSHSYFFKKKFLNVLYKSSLGTYSHRKSLLPPLQLALTQDSQSNQRLILRYNAQIQLQQIQEDLQKLKQVRTQNKINLIIQLADEQSRLRKVGVAYGLGLAAVLINTLLLRSTDVKKFVVLLAAGLAGSELNMWRCIDLLFQAGKQLAGDDLAAAEDQFKHLKDE